MSGQNKQTLGSINSSYQKSFSDRSAVTENEKLTNDQNNENLLANQFSVVNSSRKKSQDAYFRHRGDANLKIMDSNIDFILETDPMNDNNKQQIFQLHTNNNQSLVKTVSNQLQTENDRLKNLDSQKIDDPTMQRKASEDLKLSQKFEIHSLLRRNLSIGLKVQRFVKNIISFQVLKSYQYLTQFQLSVINDPICQNISELVVKKDKQKHPFLSRIKRSSAQFTRSQSENNIQEKLISVFVNSAVSCFSKVGILHPQSRFKNIWQTMHLLIMLMILYILPVEAALYDTDFVKLYPYKFKGLTKSAFGFFLLDIIVQLNSGIFDRGTIVTDRQELARKYLKNNLFLDFLTAITLFAKELGFPKYINLLILCKIPAFQKILDELQEGNLSKSNHKFQNILKLLRLVVELLFIAHLYACLFLYIFQMQMDAGREQTWLSVYAKNIKVSIHTLTWHAKYMQAFYYCVTTMTTVGYGDITPQNQIEIVFCIFTLFTLCGVFAYSFNLVGVIVQDINKKSKEFKRDICLVNYYMEKLSITPELKYQVRKYLEYQHTSNEEITSAEESYILNKLSPALKERLTIDAHNQIIKKCSGVFSQFSDEFMEKISLNSQKSRYSKGEIIFKPYQKDYDPCFYFIEVGEIDLYFESPSIQFQNDIPIMQDDEKEQTQERSQLDQNAIIQIVKELKTNDYFGEISFFTNNRRTLGAICKENARCFVIQRSKFFRFLKKYPKDYEMFCKLRDKMIMDNSGQAIGTKCFSCSRYGHTFQNCHLLQAKFDREKIFLLENQPTQQIRNQVKKIRRRRIKFNALIEIQNVKEKVELKRISLEDLNMIEGDSQSSVSKSSSSSSESEIIHQRNTLKKETMKQNFQPKSFMNFDNKYLRSGSKEKTTKLKSQNIFKQGSIEQSNNNSITNINNDDTDLKKSQSYSQMPIIEEKESLKEGSPLQIAMQSKNDQGNRILERRSQQLNHQNSLTPLNRSIYRQHHPQIFNTLNPQQQMMLMSLQNNSGLMKQPENGLDQQQQLQYQQQLLEQQQQQLSVNKQSLNGVQSVQGLPEFYQYSATPLSPGIRPSAIQIDSPHVQKFAYRLFQTDDTDPFTIFQAQFAKQQQNQQTPLSILHENPNMTSNIENISIHKNQRHSKLQLYQAYSPSQHLIPAQQDNNPQEKKDNLSNIFKPNYNETQISRANRIRANQNYNQDFDGQYVIEEYMQEFKVYYPEYNYSLIQFKFPRTTKDMLSQNPAFAKYTYYNRLVQKKYEQRKTRKQSERVTTFLQSYLRIPISSQ